MYCGHCGKEISDGSVFCNYCGGKTSNLSRIKKNVVANSETKICPNCTAVLKKSDTSCPYCDTGFSVEKSTTMKDFEKKVDAALKKYDSKINNPLGDIFAMSKSFLKDGDKLTVIQNYAIPNKYDDLLEFMILAVTNIVPSSFNRFNSNNAPLHAEQFSQAWIQKYEQAAQKYNLYYQKDEKYYQIESLFNEKIKQVEKEKKKTKAGIKKLVVGLALFYVIIGLMIFLNSGNSSSSKNQNQTVSTNKKTTSTNNSKNTRTSKDNDRTSSAKNNTEQSKNELEEEKEQGDEVIEYEVFGYKFKMLKGWTTTENGTNIITSQIKINDREEYGFIIRKEYVNNKEGCNPQNLNMALDKGLFTEATQNYLSNLNGQYEIKTDGIETNGIFTYAYVDGVIKETDEIPSFYFKLLYIPVYEESGYIVILNACTIDGQDNMDNFMYEFLNEATKVN